MCRDAVLLASNVRLACLCMLVDMIFGLQKLLSLICSSSKAKPTKTLGSIDSVFTNASRLEPALNSVDSLDTILGLDNEAM